MGWPGMSSQRRGPMSSAIWPQKDSRSGVAWLACRPKLVAAAGVDDPVHVVPAVEVRQEERDVGELLLEQVEHGAGRIGEGPI